MSSLPRPSLDPRLGDENTPPAAPTPSRTGLDRDFVDFLVRYQDDREIDPRLRKYIAQNNILNPFGDRLKNVERMFVEDTATIKPWIHDASRLEERLREYPVVYRLLYPEEAPPQPEQSTSAPPPADEASELLLKRKRTTSALTAARPRAATAELEDTGGPGPETAKRRRVQLPPLEEETGVIDLTFSASEAGPEADDPGPLPAAPPSSSQQRSSPFITSPGAHLSPDDDISAAGGAGGAGGPAEDDDGEHLTAEDEAILMSIGETPLPAEEDEPAPPSLPPGGQFPSASVRSPSAPDDTADSAQGYQQQQEHQQQQQEEEEQQHASPVDAAATTSPPSPRPRRRLRPRARPSPQAPAPPPPSSQPAPPRTRPTRRTKRLPPPPPLRRRRRRYRRDSPAPEDYAPPPPPPSPTPPPSPPGSGSGSSSDSGEAPDRAGWEWTLDLEYRGTPQPPLGVRLGMVLNFLREEDADRCRGWGEKLDEAEAWLRWVRGEVLGAEGRKCSRRVWGMVREAERKVRVHRAFEKVKGAVVGRGEGIAAVEEVVGPRRVGRGRLVVGEGARGVRVVREEVGEERRRVLVVRPERVHGRFGGLGAEEEENVLKRLNESERAFWAADGDEVLPEEHLFRLENAAYEACASAAAEAQRKFVTRDGKGGLILPAEKDLPAAPSSGQTENDARVRGYVVERGARRAALQQALRYFTNAEQDLAATDWNRVVPPVEQRVLDQLRRDLGRNHQYAPARLDPAMTPDKLETMPYTIKWRSRWRLLSDLAEHTRKEVDMINSRVRGWVTLPKGVAYGGPFVWRMVDPDVQEMQDLLAECEAVLKAILRMPVVRSREDQEPLLLERVQELARKAADGSFGPDGAAVPRDHQYFGPNDWESGPERRLKAVSGDDLKWLRFLTGRSVNRQMLEASGQSQSKLYSIFATRLEKAMDDRRKTALFLEPDKWRTIEELLDVVNGACDEDGARIWFSPFQAKYFLERAQEQGLCRYKENLEVYGRVARSLRDIDPSCRVVIPSRVSTDDSQRDNQHAVPTFPDDIRPFHEVLASERATGGPEGRFFLSLSLRLGVTIYRLRQRKQQWKHANPLSSNFLWNSMNTFSDVYRKTKAEYELSWDKGNLGGLSLAEFVKEVNLADWGRISSSIPDRLAADRHAAMEEAALKLIRHKIITESNENLSMLGRGREHTYTKADGGTASVWTRDYNWDWASVAVRGKVKQYWSLDRWPLELQSEQTRRKIQSDAFIDPSMVWDPNSDDPVPQRYLREKLRRYGEEADDIIRRRPGPAIYAIGDTPLQRKGIQVMLANKVIKATKINLTKKSRTWKERIAAMMASRRSPTPDHLEAGETMLPDVDPLWVPESWTSPSGEN